MVLRSDVVPILLLLLGVVCRASVDAAPLSFALPTLSAELGHPKNERRRRRRSRRSVGVIQREGPLTIADSTIGGSWGEATTSYDDSRGEQDFLTRWRRSSADFTDVANDVLARQTEDATTAANEKRRRKRRGGTIGTRRRIIARDRPYSSVITALRAYRAANGDLVIPRRFVVPSSEDYPAEWHGMDLASTVYDMKWWQSHVRSHPDRVAELNTLGFVWMRLQPEWNLVLEALVTYSSLFGNVRVPASFVVPYGDDQWPKATWGITLGNCVHRIRIRHDFLGGPSAMSRRAQLDGLGFCWDVNERAFTRVFWALRHFRKMQRDANGARGGYKALRVPSTFVVPSGEENGWPEELWGLQLGAKCSAIRHKELYVKNNPDRRRALEELGFQWSGNATLGWLEVIHAAAIYSRLNGRNLDVPIKYVVPAPSYASKDNDGSNNVDHFPTVCASEEAWPWPEHLWGLPLGQRLKDVRLKGAYLKGDSASARRAQLDALGFNWTPKRGRRRR